MWKMVYKHIPVLYNDNAKSILKRMAKTEYKIYQNETFQTLSTKIM